MKNKELITALAARLEWSTQEVTDTLAVLGAVISSRLVEGDCIYSVGAGDGFVSGFMYGLAKGHSIKDCSLLGSTLSSFVLEDEGSITNLPTEARLLERFSKWREK